LRFGDTRQSRGRRSSATQQRRPRGAQLRLESLEDRCMLSVAPWLAAAVHRTAAPVVPATPAITLHVAPATSVYGQAVLMTAKVPGAVSGDTVEFLDGTTVLDTASASTNGLFNFTTSTLDVGSHSITAEYFASGATTPTATSTTVTEQVKAVPTHIELTASANPVVVVAPNTTADVTFTTSVTSGGWWSTANTPTGTVTYTVTDSAGNATPTTEPLGTSFTASLAPGTYKVTATFNPTDTNYASSSTAKAITEQVVSPSPALGSGSVSTGVAAVTLRGGQQFTIDVTQDASSGLAISGNGVSYTDVNAGINLTDAQVSWVTFSVNGHQAEIVGTATNDNNGTQTQVNFTMLVNSGTSGWFSRPSVTVIVNGDGINYQHSGFVTDGSLVVDGSGDNRLPSLSSSPHDRALQDVLHDWFDFRFGFGGHHD
jgi:hypothetical protein